MKPDHFGASLYQYKDDDTSSFPVPIVQTKHPPDSIPTLVDDTYVDPMLIIRPGKRTIRKKLIYDPSNSAYSAEVLGNELAKLVLPLPDVNVKGADPSKYLPEPATVKAITKLPDDVRQQWLKSLRGELQTQLDMKTFSIAKKYNGEQCLKVTVIFKVKLQSDGTIEKLKSRVAIRGDMDKGAEGEDNGAPLATFRLLRVFIAGAAARGKKIYQADFVGAYLQAYMDRVVYVMLPKEWKELYPDLEQWFGVPLLLEKSAYGMSSAGRLWAETLFAWYIEFGFVQSEVDTSLFKYNNGVDWIVLLSYCDDTAYYCSSDRIRDKFEKAMCKRFDCKLLGQLHWFLQARITQHANGDKTLDQSRYAASMSKRFFPKYDIEHPNDRDIAKYAAPLPSGFIFTKEDCSKNYFELKKLEEEFRIEYATAIGCLLWILNTFPRLQFGIRKLAKYMRNPGRMHFQALMHMLHHVRCNHTNGLTYYSDPARAPISELIFSQNIHPTESTFYVFADSSWQDCPDTGRSTGGYHIFYQGGIVDSAMTFPTPVALSSAEAEYNNACHACVAINAMAMLINDMNGRDPDTPLNIPLLMDNTAAISMGESFKDTKHTRHINRRYHYVRYMVDDERVCMMWIPAHLQMADPATKCLSAIEPTYITFRKVAETEVIL